MPSPSIHGRMIYMEPIVKVLLAAIVVMVAAAISSMCKSWRRDPINIVIPNDLHVEVTVNRGDGEWFPREATLFASKEQLSEHREKIRARREDLEEAKLRHQQREDEL
jgi:hypothetical protein